MPLRDERLTAAFEGKVLDTGRLRAGGGWHDQGSEEAHYGLPRRRGLWVCRIEPLEQCECHPVMLFLLVQLGSGRRIRSVETLVCQTYRTGAYDEVEAPFFPPDAETAEHVLRAAVTAAPRAKSKAKARTRCRADQ